MKASKVSRWWLRHLLIPLAVGLCSVAVEPGDISLIACWKISPACSRSYTGAMLSSINMPASSFQPCRVALRRKCPPSQLKSANSNLPMYLPNEEHALFVPLFLFEAKVTKEDQKDPKKMCMRLCCWSAKNVATKCIFHLPASNRQKKIV